MPIQLPMLGADPDAPFPPVHSALRNPDGLLAMGGDLSPARLLNAYRHGIFPWYSDGQPLLWWSPDPRMMFDTSQIHLSRRFLRQLRQSRWTVRADTAFASVITACASSPRRGQDGTWITRPMQDAYQRLHALGHAHSVEVLDGDQLIGGLYGVAIGRMFFAESMFSARSGGSKVALAALACRLRQWGYPLIDAQVENPHLLTLGAQAIPRERFMSEVARLSAREGDAGSWVQAFGELAASALAG